MPKLDEVVEVDSDINNTGGQVRTVEAVPLKEFRIGVIRIDGVPYRKIMEVLMRMEDYCQRLRLQPVVICREKDEEYLRPMLAALAWVLVVSNKKISYVTADTCMIFSIGDYEGYQELEDELNNQNKVLNRIILSPQRIQKVPKIGVADFEQPDMTNPDPYADMHIAENPMVHRDAYKGLRIRTTQPLNIFG